MLSHVHIATSITYFSTIIVYAQIPYIRDQLSVATNHDRSLPEDKIYNSPRNMGIKNFTSNTFNNPTFYEDIYIYTQSSDLPQINADIKNIGAKSSQSTISKSDFQVIRNGAIGSLQNDRNGGHPQWILTGKWNMTNSTDSLIFTASFTMVKLDGTVKHRHTVSSSKLIEGSAPTLEFNGTATISDIEQSFTNVPISIKIMNEDAISLWINPSSTANHFGNTPIYGTVAKAPTKT
jgi:hypothetical protein